MVWCMPDCQRGETTTLTGEALKQMTAEMMRLKEEEDSFRNEVSERNRPLEEILCSIPAENLSISEARKIYNLLYQLTNWVGGASPVYIVSRRQRLERAIFNMPFALVLELTIELQIDSLEELRYELSEKIWYELSEDARLGLDTRQLDILRDFAIKKR
jgi:hypothetical protein